MTQLNTKLVHGVPVTDNATGAVNPPIYNSSTYAFESVGSMPRWDYARSGNPTRDFLERQIAQLEHGVRGFAFASGLAAIHAVLSIFAPGERIVVGSNIYGGTYSLFNEHFNRWGLVSYPVDTQDLRELEHAIGGHGEQAPAKAVYFETLTNPLLQVNDVHAIAEIAHKYGAIVIVDNTFATPINCRPIEWGADIVTHSTTKYMDGHATSVGGAIVDSGNFDWEAHADKYPGLTRPDASYHGLTYTKNFGKLAYITKATAQLMRDLGSIQSPQNAFLLNLGLETLHLRMPRHCANAQKVAEYLKGNGQVAWVNYCGLKGDKYYDLGQKYLPNGSCGVLSFGLKGGRDVSIRFMDNLKLAAIVTHVADARTSVLHPASHTHRQLTDEQLIEAGVAPDLIRFSVGIEDVEDIIADIEQALSK